MSLILDGTNGLSDVDGTAAAPAIRGTDTNTGIFFPAADQVAITTGGTQRAVVDASGNVGIGTSSPTARLTLASGTNEGAVRVGDNATYYGALARVQATDEVRLGSYGGSQNLTFYTVSSERARIDSSGNLLVGTTSQIGSGVVCIPVTGGTNWAIAIQNTNTSTASNLVFRNSSSTTVGSIQSTTTTTSYNTSSDYRLKENIVPMTGALAKVALLKPVTYKWKVNGSDGQGFIAHELQEVVSGCVTGEKDAVDADGNPQYQGIDTSFLVATLTAAIQELKAIVDTQAISITALNERLTALEAPIV